MKILMSLLLVCLILLVGVMPGASIAQSAPDGAPDLQLETLDSGQWVPGRALVFLRLADGRMLVGGRFNRAGPGITRDHLLRLRRDGTIDATFAPVFGGNGAVQVTALAIHGNAIYAGGFFETVNGATQRSVVRLRPDGSIEPAWTSPFTSAPGNQVAAIAASATGVYVGGDLLEQNAWGLVRLDPASGALDPGWIAQTQFSVTATPSAGNRGAVSALVAIDNDLIVGGQFGQIANTARTGVARLSQSAPVTVRAFNAGIGGLTSALALAGGHLYVGGNFFRSGTPTFSYLLRVDPLSGNPDPAWVPDLGSDVRALHAIGNMLHVGGTFSGRPPGGARLARIPMNGNGSVDAGWNPNASNTVLAIGDTCRGRLLAGGTFTTMSSLPRNGFASFTVPQVDCLFHGDFEVP